MDPAILRPAVKLASVRPSYFLEKTTNRNICTFLIRPAHVVPATRSKLGGGDSRGPSSTWLVLAAKESLIPTPSTPVSRRNKKLSCGPVSLTKPQPPSFQAPPPPDETPATRQICSKTDGEKEIDSIEKAEKKASDKKKVRMHANCYV